jgi:hypothetical protein
VDRKQTHSGGRWLRGQQVRWGPAELLAHVHRRQPVTFPPKQARQIRGRGRRKLPDRAKPGFLRHVLLLATYQSTTSM